MAELIGQGDLERFEGRDTVVTVGVFDGVHRGHQKVISTAAAENREGGHGGVVLVTFDRHPLVVTHPEIAPRLLTTLEEKVSLLGRLEVDWIFLEEFDEDTASMDYAGYTSKRLAGSLGMARLVVGYDFHLGRGRKGGSAALEAEGRRAGFGVTVVPPVVIEGTAVSSTRIRKDVEERRLGRVRKFLSRHYFFDADVTHGEGVGRKLGFPTANACVAHPEKLVPPRGVYAVWIEAGGGRYGGMMNIGLAPTVRCDGRERIEVNLFDFEGGLYGTRLRIHCVEYLREEREFADTGRLREQLSKDRAEAARLLEKKD